MHTAYNNRKNGLEEIKEPLPNTWEIVQDTYGTIIYQEQIMLIAKRVAGFDDNQTDSYLRKALAKKKRDKMDLCKQWFVYGKRNEPAPEDYDASNLNQVMYDEKSKHGPAIKGGIHNGYSEKELLDFWDTMEGYATYLFNKSHAACYSLITNITAELKTKYLAKFYASLLSMEQDNNVIKSYIQEARANGVEILLPNVNEAQENFIEKDGCIMFGLGKIKGIGKASVEKIIENAPYKDLNDMIARIPSKSFNKKVVVALIKSGALDIFNDNRLEHLNYYYEARKDKAERLDVNTYDRDMIIEFEKETLSCAVSVVPRWEATPNNSAICIDCILKEMSVRQDKKGNNMGFANFLIDSEEVKGLIFSSVYNKKRGLLKEGSRYTVTGTKDENGTLIVKNIVPYICMEDIHL